MSYETLTLECEDGIATLTLNRPESLNAITVQMGHELTDAIARVRDDPEARVALAPPVALPDLGGAGVRVLVRPAADPGQGTQQRSR